MRIHRIDRGRTARIHSRYDRIALLYDRLEAGLERRSYAHWRTCVWSQVRGPRVLEIGVGTGKNLAYYPPGLSITAIDFSAQMLERAHQRAAQMQVPVDLCQMDAQQLDFPDHTFDTIVATFVFGSVPDPLLGLREASRVTKPGGRILLLEYVRPGGILGMVTDLLDPLVFRVYGAHINRRTTTNVCRAGLAIEGMETFWKGMVQLIVAQPKGGRMSMSEHEQAGTLREQDQPDYGEEDETQRVQRIYDRNASRYDTAIRIMERLLVGGGRAWACGQAHGDVLEVAIGTGRNLRFYPDDVRLTGIDVSPAMFARARERAAVLGRDADIRVGDAQAMDFPDDRFDTVVCTLGLCTIPDDRRAIAEMKRVLRPGGTLLLLEHVRSPVLPVRLVQRLLAPLFLRCEGDHLLREPLTGVQAEGLAVERLERSKFGIMERLIARKAEGA